MNLINILIIIKDYFMPRTFLEIEFHNYENNKPLRQYVKKYLSEYTIEVIDDIENRCLLKKI